MRIVLLQNVPSLGQVGETVEVKEGYARNFLIPKKLAALHHDPEAQQLLRNFSEKKKEQYLKEEADRKTITNLKVKEIILKVKTNKQGKPYLSVKPVDIGKKLKIDEHFVLTAPIKELGEHEVTVKMGNNQAKLKVKIEPEK